jgi:hypothetical protein
VVVFGSRRFLPGVILSPQDPSNEGFIAQIWPIVEHVNSVVPKHARLLKEMVLVEQQNKPFLLTEKNTVKVKDTLDSYALEIEAAYATLDTGISSTALVRLPAHLDAENLLAYVEDVVRLVSGLNLSKDDNLFEHGQEKSLFHTGIYLV